MDANKTIAIVVEDDEAISDFFVQTLEAEGFRSPRQLATVWKA